jgi:hypothetical protein
MWALLTIVFVKGPVFLFFGESVFAGWLYTYPVWVNVCDQRAKNQHLVSNVFCVLFAIALLAFFLRMIFRDPGPAPRALHNR